MRHALALTFDHDPSMTLYFRNIVRLERAVGNLCEMTEHGNPLMKPEGGYLIIHPIAPDRPMRAEWVSVPDTTELL